MSDLRNKIIKLAYEKKDLREDLLPFLTKVSSSPLRDLDKVVSNLKSKAALADEVIDELDKEITALRDNKDRIGYFGSHALAVKSRLKFIEKAYTYVKDNLDDVSSLEAFPRDAGSILEKIHNLQVRIRNYDPASSKEKKFLDGLYKALSSASSVVEKMQYEIARELE